MIYTYLLGKTNDCNPALDLTQNVFLKFWMLKDQYHQIGNRKAYLMQSAKNVFLDVRKKNRNQIAYAESVSYDIELSKNLTESMLDEQELQRRFQQTILGLSGRRRIVFVLSKMAGWSREKIAKALGISQLTVKATLQNAIREVRKRYGTTQQSQLNKSK